MQADIQQNLPSTACLPATVIVDELPCQSNSTLNKEEERANETLEMKSDVDVLELDIPFSNQPELEAIIDSSIPHSSGTTKSTELYQQSPDEKQQDYLMDITDPIASTSTQISPIDTISIEASSSPKLSPMDTSNPLPSPIKLPEMCENLPPIMPRNTNISATPPPRPLKPKIKRRPPNLPSIQPDNTENWSQARTIETINLKIEQIRNLQFTPLAQPEYCPHTSTSGKKSPICNANPPLASVLRLHIQIDGKEVFQSCQVPINESCVFSENFVKTLPPNFNSIQLIIVETVDGRISRQVGRKSLKRQELLATPEHDAWLPIGLPLYTPLPGQTNMGQLLVCETLGQLCLDIDFDEATKELELRVLDCTSWKNTGVSKSSNCQSCNASSFTSNKRPQSQHIENPAITSLHHSQVSVQRSLPGSQALGLSGSTKSLSQRNPREFQSSFSTKKAAKFSLSPKISRKNRQSQPLSLHQQKLTGSLSSGFERKRPPSLGSQPLPRPTSPTPADFGTPGQTQSPMRRLRIVERRGLEPVRIDCSAISNSIPSTSHDMIYGNLPATAPLHQRINIPPLTPTTGDSSLHPSLFIRVSSEPNVDESSCYGSLQIELDPQTMLPLDNTVCGSNWYSLKARTKQPITTGTLCTRVPIQPSSSGGVKPPELDLSSVNSGHTRQSSNFCVTDPWKTAHHINGASAVGEMKVRWNYNMDHLLPMPCYQPLYTQLTTALRDDCNSISLLTLIQQLPINLEEIVPPLMKIFVHANQLKPFFRLLCNDYMAHSNFRDANTLFRSQSMVSKSMYEMMKFVGQDYLAHSLKPLIDLIYAKRECCEIDPARLKAGDVLENNQRRLMIYVELAFSCVVESSSQCPMLMREVFAELRSVVANFFPQREDIGRLAISSFLIMRFFSAAILNPKIFGLKREAPEPDVMRTLVLISKVLQRLANCVVSEKPLTTKEEWLTPILERVSDATHKQSMIRFLDIVSNAATYIEPSTPPSPASSSASPSLIEEVDSRPSTLKFGHMIERRSGSDKKRSFKNLIHQKKRYVTLTENELTWQKVKEGNDDLEPKGNFAVSEIVSVAPLPESKNSFCVGTLNAEVHFQAANTLEMNEWMILIEKQKLRYMMLAGRQSRNYRHHKLKIDLERELETVYSVMDEHLDILCSWKQILEKRHMINFGKDSPTSLDKLIMGAKSANEQGQLLKALEATVGRAIVLTQQIEKQHKSRGQAFKLIQANAILKSQPTTPGSPLSSPTALLAKSMDYQARFNADSNPTTPTSPVSHEFPQKEAVNVVLVDSENYLHLRSGGACKRVRKAPSTNLYDSSNKLSASANSLGPPPKSPTA